jgi:nucleotide-binding universal stress UspA family protein
MSSGPVLLCFDGSEDAAVAIAAAGELLMPREAVVVTVWEPVAVWEPYDPGALLSAGVASIGSEALGLDEIANRVAEDKVDRGVRLAREGGFDARGEIARGKTWHAICETADALDASTIVLGARGLSRVKSMLLGSVSSAVVTHAKRPVLVIPHHGSGDPAD